MYRVLVAIAVTASLISVGIFIMFTVYVKMINDKYKEMRETLDCAIDNIGDLLRENDKITKTLDHNNRKYESQFNDIWHHISRKGEPLDPDEVKDQVHQYFNMLDNIHMPGGTIECPKQCTTDQFTIHVTDGTDETTNSTIDTTVFKSIDGTGFTITSEADNSVKEEENGED